MSMAHEVKSADGIQANLLKEMESDSFRFLDIEGIYWIQWSE